jgi:hypothetical protein
VSTDLRKKIVRSGDTVRSAVSGLTGADGALRLEDHKGEGCYCEASFDPVESWIAFKKKS